MIVDIIKIIGIVIVAIFILFWTLFSYIAWVWNKEMENYKRDFPDEYEWEFGSDSDIKYGYLKEEK